MNKNIHIIVLKRNSHFRSFFGDKKPENLPKDDEYEVNKYKIFQQIPSQI